ncbi:MAG: hypothetical protein ACTIMT_15225 [Marinomonadaceae bacterium]
MITTPSKQHMRVARRIIQEMFVVKEDEVVAITADDGSDPDMTQAFYLATLEAKAKPLIMQFPQAKNNGQAGMMDWPVKALEAALKNVDVWLETNEAFTLYSDFWENVMSENDKLRYNILAGSSVDSLERVFCDYDIKKMDKILRNLVDLASTTSKIHITSPNGTDVVYETDPIHTIDFDSGDFETKKFGTAPGYLNLVPKSGTMRGNIVFDMIMHADLSKGGHVEFIMEQGRIVNYKGTESKILKDYIEGFNEENMSKISHMMLGLSPGTQKLSWEIVEDERIWGGVNFGFGHTSPMDMPPMGQVASSHFDGISTNATVWFDDTLVLKDGDFVLESIATDAAAMLSEYNESVIK